ncbi:MAG: cyclic nucleotide-binding domain-containing protein [Kiloniellaceae bacterium]
MKEQRIESGEAVYREGDPGAAVYIIEDGEVEVLREADGQRVRLGVLRRGAIFGETGVIRDRPRSTTVRALGRVKLVVITKDEFLSAFRDDNPLALPLLQMLCERLLQADSELIRHGIFTSGARLDEIAATHLLPASPAVAAQIGSEGIAVEGLPYRVGRHALPGDRTTASPAELLLRCPGGTQVSPQHFAVEGRDGRLILRDLGSHLGTVVNGVRIAHFERSDTADLRFGENDVQLGGLDSPYRFRIIVERVAG